MVRKPVVFMMNDHENRRGGVIYVNLLCYFID